MSQLERRFEIAHTRARTDWAAADLAACAARAGCELTPEGVIVPFFNRRYLAAHPSGDVTALGGTPPGGTAAHASIAIVVLHYLMTALGSAPAEQALPLAARWLTFRQLPDGLFYAQAFAVHAEDLLARRFGNDADALGRAAQTIDGQPLTTPAGAGLAPPDAAFRFQAFPRLALAVQLWEGDEEFPGRVQVLFDAHAGHYLPTEDLSGIGDWLAHKLAHAKV
jgi:hypothetical protein